MAQAANIHVIEFNPLRFAGLCGTDMGYYAFGIRTYEYYLNDRKPDWDAIFGAGYPDELTAMTVLDAPATWHDGCAVDFDAIERGITADGALDNVFELRRMDPAVHGIACFPIYRIPTGEAGEQVRRFVLNYDASAFVRERE